MSQNAESFLSIWLVPFRQVHEGINLLSGFRTSQLGRFHPGEELTFEQRIARQEGWLNHIAGLEEIDQDFFKPYWVPIQENFCQWFVDLSDPNFPVIAGYYFDIKPMGWYRNVISPSLSDLIQLLEKGTTGYDLVDKQMFGELDICVAQTTIRNEMMFNGDLPMPPVTLAEVFVDGRFTVPLTQTDLSTFILPNAQPQAIGLFPPETDIILNSVQCDYHTETYAESFKKITKIRHFIVLLREQGQDHFLEFQFDLADWKTTVNQTEDNEFIVVGISENDWRMLTARLDELVTQ